MFLLRFAKRTPAAQVREGRVVVEGRVVAQKICPIAGSQSRPVWFEMTVESYQTGSRGRGRPMWFPSRAEEQIVPFAIEDGTGRVWIAADRAACRVRGGRRETGQSGKRLTTRFVARLVADGDFVRVRGDAAPARKGEPPGPVLRGSAARPLEILFRRKGDAH